MCVCVTGISQWQYQARARAHKSNDAPLCHRPIEFKICNTLILPIIFRKYVINFKMINIYIFGFSVSGVSEPANERTNKIARQPTKWMETVRKERSSSYK